MAISVRPQKHLINILRTTSNPNFTLFLGAGASVTSGVKHAGALIEEWRQTYSDMYSPKELKKANWYDSPTEYSELFESLYDQPSQRREFIESCVKDAVPSWGYIYLANLLKKNIFNTVFTTNFDDLINEACYSFSTDLKPLVSAHDSSISSVRLTSPRPKIIKLHGDFLFDNIKNTVRELESLEDNMRSKFRQYASEFGMIVIGYSGNDRSIMETLNTLLRYDSNFPHGIYWCIRKGTDLNSLPKDLEELTRFPRFHLIEIEGFDEILADIHSGLSIELQDEVSSPYHHLATRLDNFVSRNDSDGGDENEHSVIRSDIDKLKNNLQQIHHAIEIVEKIERAFSTLDSDEPSEIVSVIKQFVEELKPIKAHRTDELHLISTPNALLAEFEFRDENFEKAKELSKKALETRITTEALTLFIKSMTQLDDMDEFDWAFEQLTSIKSVGEKQGHRIISAVVDLIEAEKYELGTRILDYLDSQVLTPKVGIFMRLNRALILRLEKRDIPLQLEAELAKDLDNSIQEDSHWITFGLSLLLQKEDAALEAAHYLDEDHIIAALTKQQPIMNLISHSLYEKLSSLEQVQNIAEEGDLELDEMTPRQDIELEPSSTNYDDSEHNFDQPLPSDDSLEENVVSMCKKSSQG
ncbi:hypothetical protein D0856_18470 [Vibrio owensii]|uniref:SIR2 family protein n=1 Tax=Vibrio owensii TaxID=696485 RepID=UPI000EFBCA72|nr:SIR2 family protein [Vibrio owensii]AYO21980.1 hypothetical protein D0856_18470 [Vibrio owensii]